ncbi:MAG: cytochrome c-type biogenesis protein CcmH [Alphaproteobacteria bacterium]|nr:cytochrome c-type biogenesis protein CcmH [Alphaproteobacteria bacterium]
MIRRPLRAFLVAMVVVMASGLGVAGLGVGTLHALDPRERLSDPVLEARARAITAELRCLVCRSESIDESEADLARDLRRLVRERIAAGQTDQQAIDFVVSRYGDYVRLLPPIKGRTVLLWGAPLLLLLLAGATLWWRSRSRRNSPPNLPNQRTESNHLPELENQPENQTKDSTGKFGWVRGLSLAGFLVVAAFGFYLLIGRPDLPESSPGSRSGAATAPPSAPPDLAKMSDAERQKLILGMVEGLESRLKSNPVDSEGWLRLAQSRLVLGDRPAAMAALAKGAGANPDAVKLQLAYALSLYHAAENDGLPSPRVERILRHILVLAPNQPEALWLVARLEAHRGNGAETRKLLDRLRSVLPKDAPVLGEIDQLYRSLQ